MISMANSEASSPDNVLPVIAEFIAIKSGFCGGKPHILGHRVKVQHIAVWHERMGMTPEEIVATYPSLSLPSVFAALAYYHSHRDEIDADIQADERFIADAKVKSDQLKFQNKISASHAQERPISP